MKTYSIPKPTGTFYTDYAVVPSGRPDLNKVFAIFEHRDRVTNKFVTHVKSDINKALEVSEDENNLYITI